MAALMLLTIILYFLPSTDSFINDYIFKVSFTESDTVPLILSGKYYTTLLIVVNAICVVITAITGYVTWSLTKPKRMFF